jgi:hypothetical protein
MVSRSTSRFQSSNTKSTCTLKHPRDLPDLDLSNTCLQGPLDPLHLVICQLVLVTLSTQQGLTCPSPGCLAHHHPRSIPDHRPPKRKSITHQIRLIKSSFVLTSPTTIPRTPFIHPTYPGYSPSLRSLSSSPCLDGTGFVLEPRTLHRHATRYTGTTDRSDTQGLNLSPIPPDIKRNTCTSSCGRSVLKSFFPTSCTKPSRSRLDPDQVQAITTYSRLTVETRPTTN